MKCQYREDPEIYEYYLLDRLSPEAKREFEAHLRDCPLCQKELALHRILISGIRETGKKEMKTEIQRQVKNRQAQPSPTNWEIYLRVAAVVLFLVIAPGMIYYYWQVLPGKQQDLFQTPAEKSLPRQPDKITGLPPSTELSEEKKLLIAKSEELKREKDQDVSQAVNETEGIEERAAAVEKPVPPTAISSSSPEADQEVSAVDMVKQSGEEVEAAGSISTGKGAREDKASQLLPAPATFFAFDSCQIQFEKSTQNMLLPDQSRSEASKEALPEVWQFRQNTQTIQISLQQDRRIAEQPKISELPEKFPVQMIQGIYPNLQMVWQLDTSLVKIDPRQVRILVDSSNNLIVQLPSGVQYLINTRTDSTEAVMITP